LLFDAQLLALLAAEARIAVVEAATAAARIDTVAKDTVVAICSVRRVDAAEIAIARVVGTDVRVVAVLCGAGHTRTRAALVVLGTSIAVVARLLVVDMIAVPRRQTHVVGARIGVVAIRIVSAATILPLANAVATNVGIVVRIAVVARVIVVVGKIAAGLRIAEVVGTFVRIVARPRRSGRARPVPAHVADRTGVAVVA